MPRREELPARSLRDMWLDRTNVCRFLDVHGRIETRHDPFAANRVYTREACKRLTEGKHHWTFDNVPAYTRVCRICGAWEMLGGSPGLRRHNGGRQVK